MRRTSLRHDLRIAARPTDVYRVTLSPLAMSPETIATLLQEQSPKWTPMPDPQFPEPLTVQSGDSIQIVLLVDKLSGQKIVEYLTVAALPQARTNSR
jgi:hypothetical protein